MNKFYYQLLIEGVFDMAKKQELSSGTTATKIMQCNCSHTWQDKQYGKGLRVFNKRQNDKDGYRCTVCGTVR